MRESPLGMAWKSPLFYRKQPQRSTIPPAPASPHFSPRCATASQQQCFSKGLRPALLLRSSGTPYGDTIPVRNAGQDCEQLLNNSGVFSRSLSSSNGGIEETAGSSSSDGAPTRSQSENAAQEHTAQRGQAPLPKPRRQSLRGWLPSPLCSVRVQAITRTSIHG